MDNELPLFDDIAEFYDETRGKITVEEIDSIISQLTGLNSVIEIGVGTGRMAFPLQERGYDITGLDISLKMLEKAKKRGVKHLVIGDAKKLPFLDKSFDAAIMIHIFHLVDDLREVMKEAGRVTRKVVISLVRERDNYIPSDLKIEKNIANIYSDLRTNYDLPFIIPNFNSGQSDNKIINICPPKIRIKVMDITTIIKPEEIVERFRHSSRYVMLSRNVPPKINDKIMNSVTEEIAERNIGPIEKKMTEYLVAWDPQDLQKL
ncbi:MAG: class I SAM-dependent methyltransferase [Thermoplasmataceae archaeon]